MAFYSYLCFKSYLICFIFGLLSRSTETRLFQFSTLKIKQGLECHECSNHDIYKIINPKNLKIKIFRQILMHIDSWRQNIVLKERPHCVYWRFFTLSWLSTACQLAIYQFWDTLFLRKGEFSRRQLLFSSCRMHGMLRQRVADSRLMPRLGHIVELLWGRFHGTHHTYISSLVSQAGKLTIIQATCPPHSHGKNGVK